MIKKMGRRILKGDNEAVFLPRVFVTTKDRMDERNKNKKQTTKRFLFPLQRIQSRTKSLAQPIKTTGCHLFFSFFSLQFYLILFDSMANRSVVELPCPRGWQQALDLNSAFSSEEENRVMMIVHSFFFHLFFPLFFSLFFSLWAMMVGALLLQLGYFWSWVGACLLRTWKTFAIWAPFLSPFAPSVLF